MIFKVDPINFVMELKQDIINVELIVDIEGQDVFDFDLSHFNMVQLHQFMDDLNIFRDILDDPVLSVNHNVLAGVNHSLNPKISLASLIALEIILMGSLQTVMSIENVEGRDFLEGLRECSLALLYFPKGVLPAIAGRPL